MNHKWKVKYSFVQGQKVQIKAELTMDGRKN